MGQLQEASQPLSPGMTMGAHSETISFIAAPGMERPLVLGLAMGGLEERAVKIPSESEKPAVNLMLRRSPKGPW